MFDFSWTIMWLVLLIFFVIVEGVTVQLVCIWFAIGSVGGAITAACGGPFWLQLVVFLLVSILVLLVGRPLLKKNLKTTKHKTNLDRVIGMVGLVTTEIDNLSETGRVLLDGLEWTARSSVANVKIPKDMRVKALSIDGVKLIVEPVLKEEV